MNAPPVGCELRPISLFAAAIGTWFLFNGSWYLLVRFRPPRAGGAAVCRTVSGTYTTVARHRTVYVAP